ncbi:conserved hypothetical protein [gamma proteobacterium HdN1]|nr:conserved hypothetical protein [gamma proteobacterium HdN1]
MKSLRYALAVAYLLIGSNIVGVSFAEPAFSGPTFAEPAIAETSFAAPTASLISDAALGMPSPLSSWKTLETPHFNIHFEKPHQAYARRLAAIAEHVHASLVVRAAYAPAGKTEIIINDGMDVSNGAATILPYRQFFIFMTPPIRGELLDDGDWAELVFTHEYMHVLHMDQAAGTPKQLQSVIGRWGVLFPQVFNPGWVIEGYAVWAETDAARKMGRGQSALYDALMRAEILAGLKSQSALSFYGVASNDWPYGQSYLYGSYFFGFIQERWGADKLAEFVAAWNRNIVPFRMDRRAQKVFGMSSSALYAEFRAWLQQRFEPQVREWQQLTGKPSQVYVLTGDGQREYVRSDGASGWYYYENNGRSTPTIMHLSAFGERKKVAEIKQFLQLDVHAQEGILASALGICDNTNAYADLMRWNGSRWKRITQCGRYLSGYWSPNGGQIAAVSMHGGQARIELLHANGERIRTVYRAAVGEAVGGLAWHPEGHLLAVARKSVGGVWRLASLDLNSGLWKDLPVRGRLPQSPRFDASGEHLFYIDDTAGRLDVRRLTLATGEVESWSHSLTAVVDFDISDGAAAKSGELATLELSENGVALALQKLDTPAISTMQKEISIEHKNNQAVSDVAPNIATVDVVPAWMTGFEKQPIQDYSPWPTLAPTAWMAFLGTDNRDNDWLELFVSGADSLGFHAWQLAPRIYYDQNEWGGNFSYVFHKRLALLGTRDLTTEVHPAGQSIILQREERGQLVWMQPINSFDTAWQVNFGIASEHVILEQEGRQIGRAFDSNLAGVSLTLDSSEWYRASISPEHGRRVKWVAEKYDAFGGGYFRGESTALDWNEYFSTWKNQVLALRWVEARSGSAAPSLQLGGESDSLRSLAGEIGFGKTRYTLRGYETGLAELKGDRLRLQTLEYRMPLASVFNGFMAPPVGLGKLSGALFYDRGSVWSDQRARRYYSGVGAEFGATVLLGYNLAPVDVSLGVAKGLDDRLGSREVYARLGLVF